MQSRGIPRPGSTSYVVLWIIFILALFLALVMCYPMFHKLFLKVCHPKGHKRSYPSKIAEFLGCKKKEKKGVTVVWDQSFSLSITNMP